MSLNIYIFIYIYTWDWCTKARRLMQFTSDFGWGSVWFYTLVVVPAGLSQAWNYHSHSIFFKHTALIEPWWMKVWGSLQIRTAFAESAQSSFLSWQPAYCEALDQFRGKLERESWKPPNITCHLITIKTAACQSRPMRRCQSSKSKRAW